MWSQVTPVPTSVLAPVHSVVTAFGLPDLVTTFPPDTALEVYLHKLHATCCV